MSTSILDISEDSIAKAATLLKHGQLVAVPTETVYGLAADAENSDAIARLYAAKGRPQFNPLIAHILDRQMASEHAVLTDLAEKLIDAFWPGPLTLVLARKQGAKISSLATAGLDTIALRAPREETARQVLKALGRPFVAPSANPSGRLSPTTATHVLDLLGGKLPLILDAGPCSIGVESTIIKADGKTPLLLRAGGIPLEQIEKIAGPVIDATANSGRPLAPGALTSHYAPRARLRLNAMRARGEEALLGFGAVEATANLSPTSDLLEAAARLFSCLHELDAAYEAIAVSPIPEEGLGRAINDRLRRAAGTTAPETDSLTKL